MATYDIGDQAVVAMSFKNSAGVPTDPASVTLKIKHPNLSETAHVFGVDANVIKDSVGEYHYDLLIAASAPNPYYYYRWVGTGVVTVAEEGRLSVRTSNFANP